MQTDILESQNFHTCPCTHKTLQYQNQVRPVVTAYGILCEKLCLVNMNKSLCFCITIVICVSKWSDYLVDVSHFNSTVSIGAPKVGTNGFVDCCCCNGTPWGTRGGAYKGTGEFLVILRIVTKQVSSSRGDSRA